ncbi:MAG: hypothetical protein ACE5I2_05960 [Anaerolineae bacterium]
MKKISTTTILALLLVLILGSTVAYAAFHWCPDDPVLLIDGTTVNVIIEIPEETQGLVNGPVEVKVHVPSNVDTDVMSYGDSFGHGLESVQWIEDGKLGEVKVEVLVPATERIPVRVTIVTPGGSKHKRGWSNEWVWCKIKL